jgi:hypothetical protein
MATLSPLVLQRVVPASRAMLRIEHILEDSTTGPAATIPAYLLSVRSLYKKSTATVVEWLTANRELKKPSKACAGGTQMSVKDILASAERVSKRKVTAPQYVNSAFKTALINRRKMTAWLRESELSQGLDSTNTLKHEHFNETLALAFKTLFPEGTVAEIAEAEGQEMSGASTPVFSNRFDVLAELLIDKESELTNEEIKAYIDHLAASEPDSQSRIQDDPLEEILEFHRYVEEMDFICSVVKQYWRMAAAGGMPISLAGWLTSAGFSAMQNICNVYRERGRITHAILLQEYLLKKSRMNIQGIDVAVIEAERSGHNPVYKQFSMLEGCLQPCHSCWSRCRTISHVGGPGVLVILAGLFKGLRFVRRIVTLINTTTVTIMPAAASYILYLINT